MGEITRAVARALTLGDSATLVDTALQLARDAHARPLAERCPDLAERVLRLHARVRLGAAPEPLTIEILRRIPPRAHEVAALAERLAVVAGLSALQSQVRG